MFDSLKYLQNFHEEIGGKELLYIISFLSVCFPELYATILGSLVISNQGLPPFLGGPFKYLNYPLYVSTFFTAKANEYLLIIIYILLGFFIFYKYLLIKYLTNETFNTFIVTFYEVVFIRLLGLFVFDAEIKGILGHSMEHSVFSLIAFFISMIGVFYHLNSQEIYINYKKSQSTCLTNPLITQYEIFHTTMRFFISATNNLEEKKKLFFYIIIVTSNFLFFCLSTVKLVKDKFTFFNCRAVAINYFGNVFLVMLSGNMIIFSSKNYLCFVIIILNGILFSSIIVSFVSDKAHDKIYKEGNELGALVYLINLKEKERDKKTTALSIIIHHGNTCRHKKSCGLCQEIQRKNFLRDALVKAESFDFYKFVKTYYKKHIREYPKTYSKTNSKEIFYLIGLYVFFYTEPKNFIAITYKFYCLRKFSDAFTKAKQSSTVSMFFSKFKLNLLLIYKNLLEESVHSEKKTNFSHLLKIDLVLSQLRGYLEELNLFLELSFKSPLEIVRFAKTFSKFRRNIDYNFLVSKENKYNYHCVLCQFALETLLGKEMPNSSCVSDTIHTLEDLLSYRFNEDKFVLALYDLSTQEIQLRFSGKELTHLNQKHFESFFPPFLHNEGKKKLLTCINSTKLKKFDFYFLHPDTNFIEKITFTFFVLPSLDKKDFLNLTQVSLVGLYKITKENLLFFTEKKVYHELKNALVGISSLASRALQINPKFIKLTLSNETPLVFSDFIKNCSVSIKKLKKKLLDKHLLDIPLPLSLSYTVEFKEEFANTKIFYLRAQTPTSLGSGEGGGTKKHLIEMATANCNEIFTENFSQGSSVNSSSSNGSIILSSAKRHRKKKFYAKNFFRYSFYILLFNFAVLTTTAIYFAIGLSMSSGLKDFFEIITNFSNFQSYFYHSSLSVLSLSCKAEDVEKYSCENKLVKYSEDFIASHNLSKNQMISEYILRELYYKSQSILRTLTQWNKDKETITTTRILDVTGEQFDYHSVSELNGTITTVIQYMSFSDAVKNFVNLINLLADSYEYLSSPVFIIAINGYQDINLTNIALNKAPAEKKFLNDSQRFYYSVVINFQKYIRRLLTVGDRLDEEYKRKIFYSNVLGSIFTLCLAFLHLGMMGAAIFFSFKYKIFYKKYCCIIQAQVSDAFFVKHYLKKIRIISDLIELYKENPVSLIRQLEKNSKEKELRKKFMKSKTAETPEQGQRRAALISVNKGGSNPEYRKVLLCKLMSKTLSIFFVYFALCLLSYYMVSLGVLKLSLMTEYSKVNYDIANYLYISFSLTQLMSLTNQTDEEYFYYFNQFDQEDKTVGVSDRFINNKVQDVIDSAIEMSQMEEAFSEFTPFSKLLDFNCSNLFGKLNDRIITSVLERYPENNYGKLLSKYCETFHSISELKDDVFSVDVIIFQLGHLLDKFTETGFDRSYEIYAYINKMERVYKIYTELLLILRPVIRYKYRHISDNIIHKVISTYTSSLVIFVIMNFLYDIFILIFLKIVLIDRLVSNSQEIINLAFSFEYF